MRFEHAAVCSPLTIASEAGRDALERGGNAVDAAITCNLVLAVAYPHMCGVGGDLMAMVWSDGELLGLNSSGALPAAARLEGTEVPERGIGSATVPGAPAGWRALAERFGTMSLSELARAAVDLARTGIGRAPGLARATEKLRWLLEGDTDANRIFLADGLLVQEELADTLEHLESFYGSVPALLAPTPFTPDDFASHSARWVEPVHAEFAGMQVFEMPPNSRGHLALEAISRLEPLNDLTPEDAEWHARLIRALDSAVRDGDTIYLCVVDADGMAVSLNQSLYMGFGSGVVIPGTGVMLHNRGAYFTPDAYTGGAVPVHTLSPAMAFRDGGPSLVFGTMGGDAQIQIHLQILARVAIAHESVEPAIAAPRWILKDDVVIVEEGLPPLDDVIPFPTTALPVGEALTGHAHAIQPRKSSIEAASDPRADGVPVGF